MTATLTVMELLARLDQLGVTLALRNGQLVLRGDEQILSDPSLLALLRQHKPGLIAALESGARVSSAGDELTPPPNAIRPGSDAITPEMLPLVQLTPADIAEVVSAVPGGAANLQDVYPLLPLQQGILFHHLTAQGADPYVLTCRFAFDTRARLDDYLRALQTVIDRHDVLRTAVLWERLPEPVQVVWRRAPLVIEEVGLERGHGASTARGGSTPQGDAPVLDQLEARQRGIDVRQAPLMRAVITRDAGQDRWLLSLLYHHLTSDHTTIGVVQEELQAVLQGRAAQLPKPVPFRAFVARARSNMSQEEHEAFFRRMLGDVSAPTRALGEAASAEGAGTVEASCPVDATLARRLRMQARALGVSAASVCHVAWAQVLARLSGQDDVIFGTVLLGRMQGGTGSDRALGMFVNTLPMRVRIADTSVENCVRTTQALLVELLHHEHASLALAQRCSGVSPQVPLFTTLLNYRHTDPAVRSRLSQQEGIEFLGADERTNYPLTFSVDDLGDDFALSAQAQTPIDPARICQLMHTALWRLVNALESSRATLVRDLDVLPPAERRQLLVGWNATDKEYGTDRCIHQAFEARAATHPRAIALEQGSSRLSYGELNARANQLAHHLCSLGVGPDALVAVCVERGMELVISLLAVLKAGGAYVPLDPSSPARRLAFLLEDSAPAVLLTQASLPPLVWDQVRAAFRGPFPMELVLPGNAAAGAQLDVGVSAHVHARPPADSCPWASEPTTNPDRSSLGLCPEHLAYVIYTSGSTGKPKGVMVEHRNLSNLIDWHCETFGLGAGQRSSTVANVAFDAAAWEIWPALCSGGTLVLPPMPLTSDPGSLLEWWRAQRLNVSFLPTPVAELAFSADIAHAQLGTLLVGGDRLRRLPRQPHAFSIVNNYGPTETTVVATSGRLDAGDPVLHIGRPIANTRIYLLDPQRQPVPIGAVGEIYVGGAGVARGYWNRPELTAERFVMDVFSGVAGARMYRTGDLGRYLPDGNIEFVGRNDHQIKLRGYRIELGEIEARLLDHPSVSDAVVLARRDGDGEARLVAYYTRRAATRRQAGEGGPEQAHGIDTLENAASTEALRAHLSSLLPDYMVPGAYVALDALPLTRHGKLDRDALPAPADLSTAAHDYRAPESEVESTLASIWAEVLNVSSVGRHDNFFELGGHSILAVTLIERMRRADLHADVRTLFAAPTVAALAAALVPSDGAADVPPNRIPPGCVAITPDMLPLVRLTTAELARVIGTVPGGAANVQDIYPLAPLQEGILFHHLVGTARDPYVLSAALSFDSRSRLDAYLQALQAVIQRHDVLRTAVLWEELTEPVQVVWRHAPLEIEELRLVPEDGETARQLAARLHAGQARLDVRRAPLMRALITEDTAHGRWLLSLLFHHLSADHSTIALVQAEIQQHLQGRAQQLPAALPFRDFVARARLGVSREEHESFFRQMLADVDTPTAPWGLQDVQGSGAELAAADAPVDPLLAARLRSSARALGVSAASICHVAWALVLARLSGQEDVVFGTVLFGRMHAGAGAERALGMFINTLPLRIRAGDESVENMVRQTQRLLAELLRHEHASLALAQRCSGVSAPAPLFSALLNYRHSGSASPSESAPQPGIELLGGQERTNYPLTLSVDDLGDGFALTAQAPSHTAAERTCSFMHTALARLVEALERAPSTPALHLDVMPAEERRRVLVEWNATSTDFSGGRCAHELVEARAVDCPEAIAVEHGNERLTYGELDARANRLAHLLRSQGVGPDARVAICVERGLNLVTGLLAVLKAGGAYVPLDPAYPLQRLTYLLDDCAPAVVLTDATLSSALRQDLRAATADHAACVHIDLDVELQVAPEVERGAGARPEHLAYVVYTSGSTGTPKGVMVEHRQLSNLIAWHCQSFRSHAGQRSSSVANPAFDASAWEIWPALCAGGTLVMPAAPLARDPESLLAWWRSQRLDVSFLPTPLAELALAHGSPQPHLTTLLTGGDRLRQLPREAPTFTVVNNYGPTETTVVATSGCLAAGDGVLHIGRPIANTRVYLLDAHERPVPIGCTGELYIGGAGVARGYLNRPELTSTRFLDDPFSPEPGARMYRTGDLGRHLPDGNIEFLGRNDHQVKIRGFRIELGEIEAQLAAHPLIGQVVVLARADEPGDFRLVAYYTRAGGAEVGAGDSAWKTAEDGAAALRAHALVALPEYMVPAAYVEVDALPLTARGKIDRAALPVPEGAAYGARGVEAPRGEIEASLAQIWEELLPVDAGRVGRRGHFFDLGGHSLSALRVVSAVRQRLGVEVGVSELFSRPVLSDFADVVRGAARSRLPRITGVARTEPLVLSYAQQRLWFLSQIGGVSLAYHIVGGLRLEGELDVLALCRALDRLVARHEALRTTFDLVEGEPVQRVAAEDSGFRLVQHDLRDRLGPERELEQLASVEANAEFNLDTGPLIRGRLIRLGAAEHVLLVTMHHIVSDGWSMSILVKELTALYAAYRAGESDPLPPLEIQYPDYAAWQRRWLSGEVLEAQMAYWVRTLSDAPMLLEVPADRPRPAQQDHGGAVLPFELDAALTARLKALGQRHGTTPFMTLLSGWAALLARLSSVEELVIGTPVANRTCAEVEGLIGLFVNTLALRLDLSGQPTFGELLQRTRSQVLQAQEHQDVPFERVVEVVKPPRSLARSPLFQVMFAWQDAEAAQLELPGLRLSPVRTPYTLTKFDLTLTLGEADSRIVGGLQYATALFDAATAARYLDYLRTLLEAMVADDQQVVGRVPLLREAECQLLRTWNATQLDYPRDRCVHELFEARAAADPSAVALVDQDRQLTYGELNALANPLAHHLRALGVRPDVRVAICIERSAEMVIALLATLKAGGAYVPLDAAYPRERLRYMIEDSTPLVVLAHSKTESRLREACSSSPERTLVIDVQADVESWQRCPRTNPSRDGVELSPDHLAYLIYTSGSTGSPKGVMVEHRSLINHIFWQTSAFGFTRRERILQRTSISFDASVWELWTPLAIGARLVLLPPAADKDPAAMARSIERHGVTVAQFVPSSLRLLLAALTPGARLGCDYIFSGGEPLEPRLAAEASQHAQRGLVNLYGPTEATIDACSYSHEAGASLDRVPIGRPIANARVYLLDEHRQPVPLGVTGELYIAGVGVARGYANRPELTAERFFTDPFAGDGRERMYKTGDLGRHLPDGNIEFLGRNDAQIKLRGFRVEPGEIEAQLAEHPAVQDAVVLLREDDPGDQRLVAYYTGRAAPAGVVVDAESLRAHLALQLPQHMLPAAYVPLDGLPLTASGKLDRRALPAPGGSGHATRPYEPPSGDIESSLARIWAELLRVERVGRHDDFFELGGHSLLATRLALRIESELEVVVAIADLFQHSVLSSLARRVALAQLEQFAPEDLQDALVRLS